MTHTSNSRSDQTGSTLHRAGDERIFAGVAGGLGEHFGVNAWWFRWAFVFLALFAGIGFLVYIVAWLVIPGPDEDEPIAAEWIDGVDWNNGGTVFGVALLGVAGILLVTQLFNVSGILLLAAVMFIVGLLLYRGDLRTRQGTRSTATRSPATGVTVDAGAVVDTVDGVQASEAVPDNESGVSAAGEIDTQAPNPPRQSKPPKPPRERSMLGRLTFAVALIVVATMALVDVSDLAVDIEPFHYFAAFIVVLGIGLLIGAWAGRARWLIIIGILLTPLLWFSMLIPTTWDLSIGEYRYAPTSVQDVSGAYEQGIGSITIDLNGLTVAELAEIGTIEASLGLGEMIIRLPDDVGVVVRADVGAGEVSGPFRTVNGIGLDLRREFGPEPAVLVLDLEVGAGVISISGPAGVFGNDGGFNIEGNN